MTRDLIDPRDSLERQNAKLLKIAESLMRRVEQGNERDGVAYALFERSALLEDEVRQRTADLERALDLLNESNARLARADRERDAARADLSAAIENVEEGFALFDSADRLVLFNRRFALHLGDLVSILRPRLHFADYIAHVSASPLLDLPEGTSRESWRLSRMRRHEDAHSIFNVPLRGNRWVQVNEHRTPDGGTVILQTDVTDIMRLEREAREKLMDDQAIMVRATLDHLDQGVAIFDRQARLVGWNDCLMALLSVSASQIRFGAFFDTLLERLRPRLETDDAGETTARLLGWVNTSFRRAPISFEFRHRDGRTLGFYAKEMPDRGFVVSITDLTSEREAAARLSEANELLEQRVVERTLELEEALADAERANASKSRFVAAASHDLLQPLSAAKLYVAALAESRLEPQQSGIVHKAQSALESVENIIEALLDISKLDSGQARLEKSAVPLGEVFVRLRDEFQPHAALKGLRLRVVDTSATVCSNPAFLTRILQNLMANAVRYTRSGTVLVGARNAGNAIRIEVHDTGPGIAEEHRNAIFREFHRLEPARTTQDGLGLGLAIVERACQRLNHKLGLVSEVGRGTVFSFEVERAPPGQSSGPPQSMARTPSALADFALIVLLVENDAEVSRAISLLLEKWNVSVLGAPDGTQALQLLEEIQIRPDAMLVDFQLGDGENGLDLIGRLRDSYGDVPVRLISANRSVELREACAARNVELIAKPLDIRELERFLLSAVPATG